jgi:hypothetical protein
MDKLRKFFTWFRDSQRPRWFLDEQRRRLPTARIVRAPRTFARSIAHPRVERY